MTRGLDVFLTERNIFELKDLLNKYSLEHPTAYRDVVLEKAFPPTPITTIYDRYIVYRKHLERFLRKSKSNTFTTFITSNTNTINITYSPAIEQIFKKLQELARGKARDEKFFLRILGILTDNVFIGPEYFHLDINNPCNLRCEYCWFYSDKLKVLPTKKFSESRLRIDTFRNLVDDLSALHTDTILFSGAGEPLMHPDVIEMIRYVKEKGMRLQLFTNGTLLTKEISETIVTSGADEIYISVSAGDEKTYVKVHPGTKKGMFRQVEDNIKQLVMIKKENESKKPEIRMLFVLSKSNYSNVKQMADWSFSLGADNVRYQLSHNDAEKTIELTDAQRDRVRKDIESISKKYSDKMHINKNIHFQLENTKDTIEWYNDPGSRCYIGWFFSRLWADDVYSFCCARKEVHSKKKRFIDIWGSKHYASLRDAGKTFGKTNVELKRGYHLIDKDCSHCGNYELNEDISDYLKSSGLIGFIKD